VVFVQEEATAPLLDAKVTAAVRRVCGDAGWGEHFILPI
jgi:hypothetical protein